MLGHLSRVSLLEVHRELLEPVGEVSTGRRSRRCTSPPRFDHPCGAKLESLSNSWTPFPLDLVSKDIVPHPPIFSSPGDDSRPRKFVEETSARSAAFCAHDPPGDNAREGPK